MTINTCDPHGSCRQCSDRPVSRPCSSPECGASLARLRCDRRSGTKRSAGPRASRRARSRPPRRVRRGRAAGLSVRRARSGACRPSEPPPCQEDKSRQGRPQVVKILMEGPRHPHSAPASHRLLTIAALVFPASTRVGRPPGRVAQQMFSRDRKTVLAEWWWTVDKELLAGLMLLMAAGVVLSFAASRPVAERLGLGPWHFVIRQAMFAALALPVMIGASFLSHRQARVVALVVLVVSLVLLWLTLRFGVEVKGAKRWISAFGQSVQPSEGRKSVV